MRVLRGLGELAAALEEAAVVELGARRAMARISAGIVHQKVLDSFGDADKLEPLAPATQADRVAKGYSANDPLYRDGSLLRAKVEIAHSGTSSGVGSPEPIQRDHELGYINARTGEAVPPRSVFKIGLAESKEEILDVVKSTLPVIFGGGSSLEVLP